MMTDMNDVTRTFTDGLKQIVDYIPKLVNQLGDGDKAFRAQKDDITRYNPSFEGMGARAFARAVEANINAGRGYHPMVDALYQNSSNLLTQITHSNDEAHPKLMNMGYIYQEGEQALEYYGYVRGNAFTDLREAALKSSDMNTVMDQGPGGLIGKLEAKKQDIYNDITAQHNRKISQLQDPNGTDAQKEDLFYSYAKKGLDRYYQHLNEAISTWLKEITGLLASYNQGVLENKVTVGAYNPPGTTVTYDHLFGIPWLPLKETRITGPSGSLGPSGDPGQLFTWDPQKGNMGIFANGKVVFSDDEKVLGIGNDPNAFGITYGDEKDVVSGNLQAGFQNNQLVGGGSASLFSETKSVGLNIAGGNISLSATSGLNIQAGQTFELNGEKGVDIKFPIMFPFLSGGLSFGPAK